MNFQLEIRTYCRTFVGNNFIITRIAMCQLWITSVKILFVSPCGIEPQSQPSQGYTLSFELWGLKSAIIYLMRQLQIHYIQLPAKNPINDFLSSPADLREWGWLNGVASAPYFLVVKNGH